MIRVSFIIIEILPLQTFYGEISLLVSIVVVNTPYSCSVRGLYYVDSSHVVVDTLLERSLCFGDKLLLLCSLFGLSSL